MLFLAKGVSLMIALLARWRYMRSCRMVKSVRRRCNLFVNARRLYAAHSHRKAPLPKASQSCAFPLRSDMPHAVYRVNWVDDDTALPIAANVLKTYAVSAVVGCFLVLGLQDRDQTDQCLASC